MPRYRCLGCDKTFDDEEQLGQRDEGIGSYEFWGFPGVDHQWVPCCSFCGDDVEEIKEEEDMPGKEINYNVDDYGKLYVYIDGRLDCTIENCENMTEEEVSNLVDELISEKEDKKNDD